MRLLVIVLLVVAGAGCQLRVTTDIAVATDGGGSIAVTVVVDDELRDALDQAGVEPREGLEEAAAAARWDARRVDAEDATGIELSAQFDDPAELTDLVESLTAGLAEDDGALLRDVSLTRTEEGGYVFEADAGLDPPRILGTLPLPSAPTDVVGDDGSAPPVFDGDALGDLLAASGDRYAVAELRVSLPTVPTAEGATVERTSATWDLPVDGLRTVRATAPPVPVQVTTAIVAAAAVGGILVGVFGVRALRRRG